MRRNIYHPVFWIIFLSFLPLSSLFVNQGMPFVHDGQDHVARIANFYQSLLEGNPVPRWAVNLNWGYGHPILMFLYPLPSYMASLFHWIGFSFVDSTKLVFGLSFIASAIAMYLWMKTAFGVKAGFMGALLYVFAPYRFVDLYVRGAIGEHVAFIFPPLICYFLYGLAVRPRWRIAHGVGASFSIAALFLAHNAIAIMFFPIIGLYAFYLCIFEAKQKRFFVAASVVVILFGLGLSAFFWVPAFFEGKYTLRDVVTAHEALTRFVPGHMFFYSPWNYGGGDALTKSLGFAQWLGVVVAFVGFWKVKEKKIKTALLSALIILGLSLFIMTDASKAVWENLTLLQKFQFPWRFLSVSVFAAAVIGGISISYLFSKHRLLLIAYCLLLIVITVPMWRPKGYQLHDESFYSGIYPGTTDTGESSPIWSVRFMEHPPAAVLEIIEGTGIVTKGLQITTRHEYRINAMTRSRILENTLFFPGWQVFVDDIAVPVEFQDVNYRGLMTFWITQGEHTVTVKFTDTKLRRAANALSLISLFGIGIVGTIQVWHVRRRRYYR